MPLTTQFAPLSKVLGAVVPSIMATGGLYYLFRTTWPKSYTWSNEWEHATEEMYAAKPLESGGTAVMNPFGAFNRKTM